MSPDPAPLAVRIAITAVDLSAWATWPADLYHARALASAAPHGTGCGCLMCADERARLGMTPLETALGALGRCADARRLGITTLEEVRRGAGY